jgi:hypothetical protein
MGTRTRGHLQARPVRGTVVGLAPATPDPGWTWPPSAPLHPAESTCYVTEEWAPASTVQHPWVRVGRWTLLYRRAA